MIPFLRGTGGRTSPDPSGPWLMITWSTEKKIGGGTHIFSTATCRIKELGEEEPIDERRPSDPGGARRGRPGPPDLTLAAFARPESPSAMTAHRDLTTSWCVRAPSSLLLRIRRTRAGFFTASRAVCSKSKVSGLGRDSAARCCIGTTRTRDPDLRQVSLALSALPGRKPRAYTVVWWTRHGRMRRHCARCGMHVQGQHSTAYM
jgi:hypothetical protein